MEIIPAINCQNEEEVADRAREISGFADWAHIDVSDGAFTFNKSWGDAKAWPKVGRDLNLEVHLMVEEPEKEIDAWLRVGVKRFVIHLEAVNEKTLAEIKEKTDKEKVELMLSIRPETPAEKLMSYFKDISEFQILAVYPGPSGQNFQPLVAKKIKFLRHEMPNATIEVDGGINEETARLAKESGADIAVSASYIFNSPDPEAAFKKLSSI